jgi:hypothetical protein
VTQNDKVAFLLFFGFGNTIDQKRGNMFSKQYLEMCKAGRDEIEYFRMHGQFQQGKIITPKPIFESNDYFHHESMGEGETKIVKEAQDFALIIATDSSSYPYEECYWIPTMDQIKTSLVKLVWSIGDTSSAKDPEDLLLRYMESRGKSWNHEKKEWEKA